MIAERMPRKVKAGQSDGPFGLTLAVRLGETHGDEFVVLPVATMGDDTDNIVGRLTKKIENHNATKKRNYKLSMSCGISCFDRKHHVLLTSWLPKETNCRTARKF